MLKKNMKLGNRLIFILFLNTFFINFIYAEERITSTPLINVEKIKPSFENLDEESETYSQGKDLKEKKNYRKSKILSSNFNWA